MKSYTKELITTHISKNGSACWIWGGNRTAQGYARVRHNGRLMLVHRMVWELFNGSVPNGLCVLHRCDNPPCCNPDHLFLGTKTDNNADRDSKQRQSKGDSHPKCKLTPGQVLEIRFSHQSVRELALKFGVGLSTIKNIVKGKTWRHL